MLTHMGTAALVETAVRRGHHPLKPCLTGGLKPSARYEYTPKRHPSSPRGVLDSRPQPNRAQPSQGNTASLSATTQDQFKSVNPPVADDKTKNRGFPLRDPPLQNGKPFFVVQQSYPKSRPGYTTAIDARRSNTLTSFIICPMARQRSRPSEYHASIILLRKSKLERT